MNLSRSALRPGLLGALFACALAACGPEPVKPKPPPPNFGGGGGGGGGQGDAGTDGGMNDGPVVDLRADVNRNGVVELDVASEDEAEDAWKSTSGAVFLANIDDDQKTCPTTSTLSDNQLAACNDAADDVINGEQDLADLARLKTAPRDSDDGAVGMLTVNETAMSKVRLFKNTGSGFEFYSPGEQLTAEEVKAGVEFGIEATDIVRNLAVWDGYADITFTVQLPEGEVQGEDTVRLRVSPVMTFHHLLNATKSFASEINDPDGYAFNNAMRAAASAAGVPGGHEEVPTLFDNDGDYEDQWNQDFFETGYMSMPAEGGTQKVIRVVYRSANIEAVGSKPLRHAGRSVFLHFRGPDRGGIQEYDTTSNPQMGSLNSFGNTETVPPYTLGDNSYPLGRLMRGSTSTFYPDRKFSKMMEAQGQQPPIYLDTSWLWVSHVDETISFLKASNPRGWVMLANDAAMAKQMLQNAKAAGNGSTVMFQGKYFWNYDTGAAINAQTTIDQVLANADVMNESALAAVEVDSQVAKLKTETGITDAEIVSVPFLHMAVDGFSIAYQPGTVNGIVFNDRHFGSPAPHGPVIDGQDIFKVQLESVLEPLGYTVHWIEDWDLFHRNAGEVHCGSNTEREIPSALWWESGR